MITEMTLQIMRQKSHDTDLQERQVSHHTDARRVTGVNKGSKVARTVCVQDMYSVQLTNLTFIPQGPLFGAKLKLRQND